MGRSKIDGESVSNAKKDLKNIDETEGPMPVTINYRRDKKTVITFEDQKSKCVRQLTY